MKRIFMLFIILNLIFIILIITPNYADNVAVNETESFSWSVPASIELDATSALNVAITDSTIGAGKKISISLTESANFENNKFYLKIGETSTKVEYEIVNTSNQVQGIGSNLVVLESGYSSANSLYTARTVGSFTYAGTYTDRLSFVATCIANTYTVNYNGNGATSGSTASSSHTCGEAKTLTSNGFVKTGYTFVGWTTSDDGTGTLYTDGQSVTNLSTINGATVNLYAKWRPNVLTVNYNGNGATRDSDGNAVSEIVKTDEMEYGASAETTWPTDYQPPWSLKLVRDGYSPSGRYIVGSPSSNITITQDMYETTVNGIASRLGVLSELEAGDTTVTIYAGWTPVNYTISYNLNGGTASDNPTTYTIESSNITLNAPTKSGYTFAGWTENQDGLKFSSVPSGVTQSGNQYTFTNSVSGNELSAFKIQLNANSQWLFLAHTDVLGYHKGEYTYTGSSGNHKFCFAANGNKQDYKGYYDITLEQNAVYVYEFNLVSFSKSQIVVKDIRFYKKGSAGNTALPVDIITTGSFGNRSYTATWTPNNYSISYSLNGGTVSSANPTNYNINTATFSLNNPTRSGYTFWGWTGSNDLTTDLGNYTISSPLSSSETSNHRDIRVGNDINVLSGQTYRVFVTAKRTTGSISLQGGLFYTVQTLGKGWDGYEGTYTLIETLDNGWGRYYKDVTVPEGKTQAKIYFQIEQSSSANDAIWQFADMAVTLAPTSVSIPIGSTGNRSYRANWKVD